MAGDSNQAVLRHPEDSAYRCFLPNLTGFTGFRRAGPGSLHLVPTTEEPKVDLKEEFSLARADCEFRAPLSPRLARPDIMVGHGLCCVNCKPAQQGLFDKRNWRTKQSIFDSNLVRQDHLIGQRIDMIVPKFRAFIRHLKCAARGCAFKH